MPLTLKRVRRPRTVTAGLVLAGVGVLVANQTIASNATPSTDVPSGTAGPVWSDVADGFASIDGLTTGGIDGKTVVVSTYEDLAKYASAVEPLVIKITDTIELPQVGGELAVASDKTLVGVGTAGAIVNGGISLADGVSNVIIRNLTIGAVGEVSASAGLDLGAVDHVWIDHNTINQVAAGTVDKLSGITNLTLSWNVLNGQDQDLGLDLGGVGTAKITAHHNLLVDVDQLSFTVKKVKEAHLYNNYLENVKSYGDNVLAKSKVLVEGGYLEQLTDPVKLVSQVGEVCVTCTIDQLSIGKAFEAPYPYVLDQASAVPSLVKTYAGPQANLGL